MRLGILSAGNGWHVRDLQRAAGMLGHEATAIDFRRVTARVGVGRDSLQQYDGVVVRTMPPGSLEQVVFRMDALQRAEAAGAPIVNPPRALEVCVDKYLASARLAAAGLPVPPTIVCQDVDSALEAFDALGGDVIVKPLFGSEGRGMLRLSDRDLAWRALRTLERLQCVLYLQQYIPHPGWDLRVLVIAGDVVAAMRRHGRGSWRTNVAQGGKGEPIRLGHPEARLATEAAAALETPVAGVDLLPGPHGQWYVLELNAVPGWRALARVTGIDVATLLIQFIARQGTK